MNQHYHTQLGREKAKEEKRKRKSVLPSLIIRPPLWSVKAAKKHAQAFQGGNFIKRKRTLPAFTPAKK